MQADFQVYCASESRINRVTSINRVTRPSLNLFIVLQSMKKKGSHIFLVRCESIVINLNDATCFVSKPRTCSLRTASSPVLMKCAPSIEPVVENDQQLPQAPWFFTPVTPPFVVQSTYLFTQDRLI